MKIFGMAAIFEIQEDACRHIGFCHDIYSDVKNVFFSKLLTFNLYLVEGK